MLFIKSRSENNSLVRGEYFFFQNQCNATKNVMHKEKFITNMVPGILSTEYPVKADKLHDVQNFLMKNYDTEY